MGSLFYRMMSGSKWTLFLIHIAISLLLDCSAILFNGLVAFVLKKHKKTRIVTFWFIYCLSISDTLVGVTGLIYHVLWLTTSLTSGTLSRSSLTRVIFKVLHYLFQTSGQLIFIIAVDRYIHMKYSNKYSTIMTQSKALLIMLFNIAFGILLIIPLYVGSDSINATYNFVVTVLRGTCALLICIMYLKTYFSIKRQLAALQLGSGNETSLHHEQSKRFKSQNTPSRVRHCSSSVEVNSCAIVDSEKAPSRSLSCADLTDKRAKSFDCRSADHLPSILEKDTTSSAVVLNEENYKTQERRQTKIANSSKIELNQKSKRRKASPEQQFRKAVLTIFLTLLMCYIPFFIHEFYFFANKRRNSIMSVTSFTGVLLNSTLNAIILIAFSKEMQRGIKAVFVKV